MTLVEQIEASMQLNHASDALRAAAANLEALRPLAEVYLTPHGVDADGVFARAFKIAQERMLAATKVWLEACANEGA